MDLGGRICNDVKLQVKLAAQLDRHQSLCLLFTQNCPLSGSPDEISSKVIAFAYLMDFWQTAPSFVSCKVVSEG